MNKQTNNKHKEFDHSTSGHGLIPGFLAGTILTGALSIFLYQKDKGKTFGQIADKVQDLIADYLNPNSKPKSSPKAKKTVDIPIEILHSAPQSKDELTSKTKSTNSRTFTKSKK
jgi:hypothetical protein